MLMRKKSVCCGVTVRTQALHHAAAKTSVPALNTLDKKEKMYYN